MTLRLTCLGEFQITLAGEPLTAIPTDKARALLVYLAVEGKVYARSDLVQLLWPGYSAESANNNLRQSLHRLRQLLNDDVDMPRLLTTRQTVQINPDAPISIDVTTFTGLLADCRRHVHTQLAACPACMARLQQAVDLYQGDFLAGFTVVDSDEFEEWRRITQEQLHIQALDALTQLADAAESNGDFEDALRAAQRQLTLEPWLEAAHRRVMRLLAQRGHRAAALAQYQRCRQVLVEELGVEPDDDTTALYEQIRNGQLSVTPATERAPAPPPRPVIQPAAEVRVAAAPPQLAPLLGRADELAHLVTLLAQPGQRLVTLVGPPGVGKTRLAQAILDFSVLRSVGESEIESPSWKDLKFEDGIHFIDLSVLRDPALLVATMAQALRTAENGLRLTEESLIDHLRTQEVLLVLDNFEQVLPGVSLLRHLLAECPSLKFLITSRVPLRLPGEQMVAINPLPLPDLTASGGPPSQGAVMLETVARNGAVQLFCQRAAAVAPGFTLTERLVPVVVEICRRLDGLPLAIELAAAHSRLLPPPALLERLTQAAPGGHPPLGAARLALLTNRSSARPERQQTLRAAIAWSYDLLEADEQRLFRQLSVFAGGATLAAIEAVISSQADAPPQANHALLTHIEALVDKNLLRHQELSNAHAEGEPRLFMLETLREYGRELLTAAEARADGPGAQERHADYFLAWAEMSAPKLHGPDQVAWLDRLALDQDNLRAALDWFVEAGQAFKALRLATALRYFWRVRGHYREGYERLAQMLARPEAAAIGGPTDTVRARALNAAGYLQWVQGNRADAQKLLQEALTLGRAVPDAAATAFALRYLGLAADARQERATARQWLEESLAIYRTLDAPNETALALMYLGDVAFGQQAYAEAERLYEESADLLRSLGNNVVLPYALRHLGYLALVRGDLATALALSTESLRLNLAAGEQQGSAAALTAVAAVAVAGEQWEQAARLLAAVDTWLTTSRAQLLPIDRTYHEQTQQRLQQHRQGNPSDALADADALLSLEQALAYVQHELTFGDESRRQGDEVTSDEVTSDEVTSDEVTSDEVTSDEVTSDEVTSDEVTSDEVTSDKVTSDKVTSYHVTESPSHSSAEITEHPVIFPGQTQSPSHPVTQSPPHNLPAFAAPLVGRDGALAELDARLQQPGVRLLTLVGPGGMGKTRLAVAAGEARLAAFANGVWFVPLASISTADALPGAIATALGITLQGSEPRQALLQSLSTQQLLLILDNYEQLLVEEAAVDLVTDLLARAPGVQILITSRQRLNLRREQLYPVQALTFPSTVTLAEATSASAVRLFVQAVQRVQADFHLTASNLPAVLRICQLVQGMPLGLELAAANADGAPLRAIADALEQNAEILAVEWRDLPARQRSMRAVFAWSWRLLSAAEQRVLRQSARFRGGFDYTAAQAVISATPALLTALVNKSLLQWQAAAPGEGRYAMHELLRQFAAEALAESGERAVVEERHGRYYLAYLAARGFRLGRSEPKEASAEIQVELENIRLAWHWAATQGALAELDQALYAWWQFCLLQGLGGEAQQSLAAALTGVRALLARQADDAALHLMGTRLLAKLLALHANFLFAQGRDAEMAAQAREAMQLGAASGGFEGEILGNYVLGRVLQDAGGQKREAQALWEQTIQLVQRYQPQQPENELLHELHWMAHIMLRGSALHFGDYVGCRAHIIEALRICQTLGKQRGELTCLSCMGEINFFLYDFAAAEADFRAELALGRSLGYRLSEMSAQEGLARVARLRGDYATARTLLEQSLGTAAELAFHYDEALWLAALIRLHCQLGDQAAAAVCQDRLTQLLAQVPLGKECRLYACLAAAFKAHYAGDKDEALAAAEQANQINQQGGDILFRLVDTALILGHVRAAAGQWAGAQSAFQEALTAFQQFNNGALSAEPQAGLAQIALAQGNRVGALAQIETLLPALAAEPHAGYNDPFFIYLTAYRVLAANADQRADSVLQQGYDLLQQDAAKLDEESRQRFLTNVAVHRDLVAAFAAMQAARQGDKVTSDKVTSASSVTLSPSHLVTPSPLHNLPATLTPFVGRTRSIAEILSRLQQGARLLTLVGPGGMGKTRLALAVGQQLLAAYPDGVWFIALAAITNPAAIATAIASALRLSITGDDPRTALARLLQPKRLLLILDNFEQILAGSTAGVELIAALVQAAPGVQMLVTSRERLQLRSEQLYQVPPLSVAPHATLAEATATSAARLFVQSAQLVQADFQLTPTNLAAVLRICELVQGMPLGLELAAARVGTLPLDAIADAIAQSAEFLTVDWVDLPARQRSMRAVFTWSWQLLDATEQQALRKVSIFRGGFTREAAQTVAGVALSTLTRLVHRSLLYWAEQGSAGRYAIHELLRQFATEELARVATEQEDVAARHSEFYLNYLAVREARLTRAEPRAAAAEIQTELDNIRQAWQGAAQRRAFSPLQRSAWALFSFYRHTGLSSEALQTFQALTEQILLPAHPGFGLGQRQPPVPPQSRLVAIYAYLLTLQSKLDQAIVVAQGALTLAQAEETTDAAALSQLSWGQALRLQGRLAEAQAHLEQTLQLARLVTDPAGKSDLLYDVECLAGNALGALLSDWGSYQQAREHFRQSLHLAQSLGKRRLEINALLNLANLARMAGEYPAARQGYEDALRLTRAIGYRWGEGISQYELAHVLRRQGEYSRAATLLENVLLIFQEIGEHFRKGSVLIALGQLYAYVGDLTAAAEWLTRYQQFIDQTQVREATIHHLQARTALAFHQEDLVQALAYATEGWQMGQTQGLPDIQAYGLIGMGHAQRQLGRLAEATTAYQQALDLYTMLQRPDLAAEAQVGLAACAQQQGDLARALGLVETVLAQLTAQPISGQDEPFILYLTCYQVLAATQDPRAPTILQQGYRLLQRYAEQITEERLRQAFLENVPVHRALQQAYAVTSDKVTSDKVTRWQGDKVTERAPWAPAAGRKVTESPRSADLTSKPHPVTLSPLLDWAEMPAVDFFVERTAEVAQLTEWLMPTAAGGVPAQLISILGMGGMGKTTLAAAVTKAVAPAFAVVIWRSLLNAPPLNELLCNWLQLLSRQTLTTLPESLDEQLRLLLTYLQQERCLLVLDNVESIFAADTPAPAGTAQAQSRAGVTRPGYEGYDQLFQRLASSNHQSCLLLTSREQPYALLRVPSGRGRQTQTAGRIQVLPLTGLDQQAGQALLQNNGLHASAAESAQLVENYSGNPLALQIVAATIADFFGGDVAAFQQEEGQFFDGLRLVLDQQFARLSPLERDILVWLAIEREPVTVPTLRSNFVQSLPTNELLEALQALQNRSILEKRDTGLTLQNVIIEYTTEYLVEQVYREIVDDKVTGWQGDKVISSSAVTLSPPPPVTLSFLNRFALLKAQAKEYVRQSQVRLIVQPLANRLLTQLGKAQVEERVTALVQQLQAVPVTRGYAGGNLLNLLLHIGSELRGRDFAHIALWQVFLAGAYAPGLNLAGADLTGTVFTQRFGALHNIQFDAQGDLLLADIDNQRLRLLRLHDGRLYHEVALPAWRFAQLYLSPDCQAVLMTLADHQVTLLDLTTGKLSPAQTRHQHPIWRACFSPDGQFVATGDSSGLICLWARPHGHLVQARQITADAISALAIAPDGETMASANVAGMVFLWSLADHAALRRLQGHDDEVATLSFLDNGRLLASGSHDLTVGIWDVATGELRQRLHGHTRPIRKSVATTTGQGLVTGGGDHFLYVWDWQRAAPLHLLADHASPIEHLVISANGKQAATLDLNTVVSLWDLTQGRRIDYYAIYYNAIMSIQFSPDGEALVTGGSDGAVYLWQVQGGGDVHLTARFVAHKQRIFTVAFHPDGNLIASGGDGSAIALWARSSGQLLHTLQGHAKNISMLAFSPNGQWLASSSGDGAITLWSIPAGRQRRQLQVHSNMVTCCAFSPNRTAGAGQPQQRLASGSFDRTLAIWDAESGALLHHLHGHTNAIGRCIFSHDGQRLISISYDETLRIWDVESGEQLTTWPQLGGGYIALDVHPAGQLLAVSCMDCTIRLLELSSGRCLAELHGHSQPVISLAIHPNEKLLASAGSDETIRLWDISSAALETGQIACLQAMQAPSPYAGMQIGGVTGLSDAQKAALRALGAIEE